MPSDIAHPFLDTLYVATNQLTCPVTDYATWTGSTDYELASLECSTPCEAEVYDNAQWPTSFAFVVQGVCVPGFTGTPTRACNRQIVQRVWNATVTNPCRALTIVEQCATLGLLLLIPGIPCLFLAFFSLVVFAVPHFRAMYRWRSLLHAASVPVRLLSLALDFYFLVNIYSESLPHFIASITFLSFALLCNTFSTIFVFSQIVSNFGEWSNTVKVRLMIGGFLSLFGLSNLRAAFVSWKDESPFPIFKRGSVIAIFVDSLSLSMVFFKDAPLTVIELSALSLYFVPFSVPLAVIANLSCLLFGATMEGNRWLNAEVVTDDIVVGKRRYQLNVSIGAIPVPSRATSESDPRWPGERPPPSRSLGSISDTSDVEAWRKRNRQQVVEMLSEPSPDQKSDILLESWAPVDAPKGDPDKDLMVVREPYLSVFLYPLVLVLTPFVSLTFLPHLLTGFGIPLAMASFKRFLYLWKGDPSGEEIRNHRDDWNLTWYQARGTFLLPVNLIGQVIVLLVFFATVTVMGMVVGLLAAITRFLLCRRDSARVIVSSFKQAYDFVLSYLFWIYFPYFTGPPSIREAADQSGEFKYSTVENIITHIYFFVGELAIPIADVTTDFIYAFALLSHYRDPNQGQREILFNWLIVAFVSTCFGAAAELFRITFLTRKLSRRGFNRQGLARLVHEISSIFVPVRRRPSKARVSKFMASVIEDAVQIAVVCNTISYVDRISPLWGVQLAVSVTSAGFHISRFAVNFIYGRGFVKWVEYFFNTWLFGVIVVGLGLIAGFTTNNIYCDLSKSIDLPAEMIELGTCPSLGFNLSVTGLPTLTTLTMILAATTNPITFEGMTALQSLDFSHHESISSPVVVNDNPNLVNLTFPVLSQVMVNGSLTVSGNSQLSSLSFSKLELVGGFLVFSNNGGPRLDLLALSTIPVGASITVSSNSALTELGVATVETIDGTLEVFDNQALASLDFLTIKRFYGELFIHDNLALRSISFPSMVWVKGQLVIQNNAALEAIAINLADTIQDEVTITGNPSLRSFSMNKLIWMGYPPFRANFTISDNAVMSEISMPNCIYIADSSYFTISDNPGLTQVNLPSLTFLYSKWMVIANNPVLTVMNFADGVYNPSTATFTSF